MSVIFGCLEYTFFFALSVSDSRNCCSVCLLRVHIGYMASLANISGTKRVRPIQKEKKKKKKRKEKRNKNRIKRSRQARLIYVKNINLNTSPPREGEPTGEY